MDLLRASLPSLCPGLRRSGQGPPHLLDQPGPLVPSSQAAEQAPLAGPLRRGDQEPGKGTALLGAKGWTPAWAMGVALCPEGYRTPGMAPGPTSVYSVNYSLYITFSIPIVTKLIFMK